MTKIILLDSTPVGLITNPKSTPLSIECQQWFSSLFDRQVNSIDRQTKIRDFQNQCAELRSRVLIRWIDTIQDFSIDLESAVVNNRS